MAGPPAGAHDDVVGHGPGPEGDGAAHQVGEGDVLLGHAHAQHRLAPGGAQGVPLRFGQVAVVPVVAELGVAPGGAVAGLGLPLLGVAPPQPWLLLVISVLVGATYAGMGNIMLNGLGIELSPKDNPGYLPGLNAGAFNLGAGISFAILYAVKTAAGDVGRGAYVATIVAGVVLLALAFLASLLIPRAAADGATVSEVARRVHLSEGTTRNHLSQAMAKTGAPTRAAAVHIAAQKGWIIE